MEIKAELYTYMLSIDKEILFTSQHTKEGKKKFQKNIDFFHIFNFFLGRLLLG